MVKEAVNLIVPETTKIGTLKSVLSNPSFYLLFYAKNLQHQFITCRNIDDQRILPSD